MDPARNFKNYFVSNLTIACHSNFVKMNIDTFIYLDAIRKYLSALPGITEKLCFGTPAFYVNDKLFARLKENGDTLGDTYYRKR